MCPRSTSAKYWRSDLLSDVLTDCLYEPGRAPREPQSETIDAPITDADARTMINEQREQTDTKQRSHRVHPSALPALPLADIFDTANSYTVFQIRP